MLSSLLSYIVVMLRVEILSRGILFHPTVCLLQHPRHFENDLRPGQRMRSSAGYPQCASSARSETKTVHAVRRILEIMRDTDTPSAAARTLPTNRFFDSPVVEPADDPQRHSAGGNTAGAGSPGIFEDESLLGSLLGRADAVRPVPQRPEIERLRKICGVR
jgi:hypothetical protein